MKREGFFLLLLTVESTNLEHQGWIVAKWAQTAAGRRAKYYSLTRAGRLQFERESKQWRRLSSAVTALLGSV